jgi:hypothetical protein
MFMKHGLFGMLVISAALISVNPVWAGSGHSSHGKPQHGGIVTSSKDLDLELVLKPGSATLFVSDHGKSIKLDNASAKLTLLVGSAKSELPMSVNADRFEAKGEIAATKGTKVIASITLPGKGVFNARFELK